MAASLGRHYRERMEIILGCAAVLAFLGMWEWAGTSGVVNPLFISAPSHIFKAAVRMVREGTVWKDMAVSGYEFGLGYGLAVLVGVALGITTGWYREVYSITNPFLVTLYVTPRIALMPLLIIWFGLGLKVKVVLVFVSAVFPVLVSMQTAMRTLDAPILKAARSFNASTWQVFKTVAFPSSVPFLITGLRLGVGRGLIGMVVGEMVSSTAGVGYRITMAGTSFQTHEVFVGVFIIAGFGMSMDWVLRLLERRFESWRPQHQG